ncbi:amino acid adenylation domain-containing protein [Bradyrhizobium sp.]
MKSESTHETDGPPSSTQVASWLTDCNADTICAMIRLQALRTPEAVALIWDSGTLTFRELLVRADALARYLMELGASVETPVGVFMERSPELVVAVLAILNSGGCYVPLDPTLPDERLRTMVASADIKLVVGQAHLAERGRRVGVAVIAFDQCALLSGDEAPLVFDHREPASTVSSQQLAYIIFTSGSTGAPKGLMVEHGAVVNRLRWMIGSGLIGAGDRVLLRTPFAFDASVWELFVPLAVGAKLCIAGPNDHRDPAAHIAAIQRWEVTVIQMVPSFLVLLLKEPGIENCRSLRRVFFGGEPASASLLDDIGHLEAKFYNLYGPAETTIDVTCWEVGDGPYGSILPIGRPNTNVRIDILDAGLRPVPIGTVGEIVVSGLCLARGYVGGVREGATRFVQLQLPQGPVRAYRTGDLGVQRADGVLEFVGRADRQVKIAGVRIEPAEIENVLLRHATVRHAVVSMQDVNGRKRLVAHVIGHDLDRNALRSFLEARLERRMIPAYVVLVSEFQRTLSGKIDLAALPSPNHGDSLKQSGPGDPPTGSVECQLAEIWQRCLGIDSIGRRDRFLDLGGDSLAAIYLLRELRQRLGVNLSVHDLLSAQDVAGLAAVIAQRGVIHDHTDKMSIQIVASVSKETRWRLSPAQEGLWTDIEYFGADRDARYNIGQAVRLRGALDQARLEDAFNLVVQKHDVLRSLIIVEEGEPMADPHEAPHLTIEIELVTEAEVAPRADAEVRRPFQLSRELPLRVRLLRLGLDDHVLVVTIHHLAADDWTLSLILRELGEAYRSDRAISGTAAAHVGYGDYARWHRSWAASEEASAAADRWRKCLAAASRDMRWLIGSSFPSDTESADAATVKFEISPPLVDKVRSAAAELGATEFMVLFAALADVVSAYARTRDVVIGVPASTRMGRELDEVAGYCVNLLPIRLDLTDAPDFCEIVARSRATIEAALADRHIPFPAIVNVSKASERSVDQPLVQVALTYQSRPVEWPEFPGVTAEPLDVTAPMARFPLEVHLVKADGRISGQLIYQTRRLSSSTANGISKALVKVLESGVAVPTRRVSELHLVDEGALETLATQVDRAVAGPGCLPTLFHRLRRHPAESLAVVQGARTLTYGALIDSGVRLASRLLKRGIEPMARIVVCLPRGPEQIISQLAASIVGASFVTFDTTLPAARLNRMASLIEPTAIITDARADIFECSDVLLDIGSDEPGVSPTINIAEQIDADSPAYVVFTSGSTGEPKAVVVPYRGLDNLIAWHCETFELTSADRCSRLAGCGFDASIWETWPCLCAGATLVIASTEDLRSPESIRDWLVDAELTVAFLPTPLAEAVFDLEWPPVSRMRLLLTGGDRLARRPPAGFPSPVINNYGPSECSVVSTSGLIASEVGRSDTPDIGRPISGFVTLVLDQQGRVLAPGAVGELAIAGRGLATGYYGRPDLTAEAFPVIELVAGRTDRVYRTGDLCRCRPDGAYEFLGRADDQLKIRGNRVEPRELEVVLAADPTVSGCIVVPVPGGLAAFVVCKPGFEIDVHALKSRAARCLPSYMLPTIVSPICEFPLTANGKIDRGALALRAKEIMSNRSTEIIGSGQGGKIREAIAAEMKAILGVPQLAFDRSFFEQGGDSLKAMKLLARIEVRLRQKLRLAEVFEHCSVESLAALVASKTSPIQSEPQELDSNSECAPLSPAQQSMYAEVVLNGDRVRYNCFVAWRFEGNLDLQRLVASLQLVVARHDALRTAFEMTADGGVVQRVFGTLYPLVRVGEIVDRQDAVDRFIDGATLQTFDLARGPLIALDVAKLGQHAHVVVVTVHHLVMDEYSMGIVLAEIARVYGGDQPGKLENAASHLTYARAALARLSPLRLTQLESYWRGELEGAPRLLELCLARPRPAKRSYEGLAVHFDLPASIVAKLSRLGTESATTLYTVLLTGFAQALARLGPAKDVVVAVPAADRVEEKYQDTVGFLVGLLPIRCRTASDEEPVSNAIHRVRETFRGALAHSELSFDRLLRAAGIAGDPEVPPLCQALFVMPDATLRDFRLGEAAAVPLRPNRLSVKFDLALVAQARKDGGLSCSLEYALDLYDEIGARAVAEAVEAIWRGLAAVEARPAGELPIVLPETRNKLLGPLCRTGKRSVPTTVISGLLQQLRQNADRSAVSDKRSTIVWADFDTNSRSLAAALVRLGIKRGDRVGLLLDPKIDLVVAVAAIWRAGAAYLPLSLQDPVSRLAEVIADLEPRLILAHDSKDLAAQVPVAFVDIDSLKCSDPVEELDCVEPSDLAYVVMTSGSSGRPKGVMINHGALASVALEQNQLFGVTSESRLLQFVSLSFDVAACDIAMALMSGACLQMVDKTKTSGGAMLVDLMRRTGVTHAQLPAPVVATLPDTHLPDLAVMVCGGDVCDRSIAQRWSDGRRFFNAYGPTEATVCATLHEWDGRVEDPPIGRPLTHVEIYVVDEVGRLVPIGVPGELWLAGPGLSRGYWKRDALMEERFLVRSIGGGQPRRIYRTGDIVAFNADGTLRFLGRRDNQVKIRGHRIELEEVAVALRKHPMIAQVVVAPVGDNPHDRALAAYFVPRSSAECDVAVLWRDLEQYLPPAMRPSYLVPLAEIPLNQNGKIDLGALPPVVAQPKASGEFNAEPRDVATINKILAIWRDVLGNPDLGPDDDFFRNGGQSLIASVAVGRMSSAFGSELPLRAIFEAPTARAFAHSQKLHASSSPRLSNQTGNDEKDEAVPSQLALGQEELWALHATGQATTAYNVPAAFRIEGELDQNALGAALAFLVARHDSLRIRVAVDAGRANFVLDPPPAANFDAVGLAAREADAWLKAEMRLPFDLEAHSLYRFKLRRVAHRSHVLSLVFHHLVVDGWSMGVLFRELSVAYGSFVKGRQPDLAAAPSYVAFAGELRARLKRRATRHAAFWQSYLSGADRRSLFGGDLHDRSELSSAGAALPVTIPAFVHDALRLRLQQQDTRATIFVVLQACLALTLGRLGGGRRDVLIATDVANRSRPEAERLVGLVVNQVPLRVRSAPSERVHSFLGRLDREVREALDHAELPFGQIVRALSPDRRFGAMPITQAKLVVQPTAGGLALDGLQVSEIPAENGESKFDLLISVAVTAHNDLSGRLEFRKSVLPEWKANAVWVGFEAAVKAVAAGADRVKDLEEAIDRALGQQGRAATADYDAMRRDRLASLVGRRSRTSGAETVGRAPVLPQESEDRP